MHSLLGVDNSFWINHRLETFLDHLRKREHFQPGLSPVPQTLEVLDIFANSLRIGPGTERMECLVVGRARPRRPRLIRRPIEADAILFLICEDSDLVVVDTHHTRTKCNPEIDRSVRYERRQKVANRLTHRVFQTCLEFSDQPATGSPRYITLAHGSYIHFG